MIWQLTYNMAVKWSEAVHVQPCRTHLVLQSIEHFLRHLNQNFWIFLAALLSGDGNGSAATTVTTLPLFLEGLTFTVLSNNKHDVKMNLSSSIRSCCPGKHHQDRKLSITTIAYWRPLTCCNQNCRALSVVPACCKYTHSCRNRSCNNHNPKGYPSLQQVVRQSFARFCEGNKSFQVRLAVMFYTCPFCKQEFGND